MVPVCPTSAPVPVLVPSPDALYWIAVQPAEMSRAPRCPNCHRRSAADRRTVLDDTSGPSINENPSIPANNHAPADRRAGAAIDEDLIRAARGRVGIVDDAAVYED